MAKKEKNVLKIAAATSMTIFSLMSCFMGTLAWFEAKRTQNNSTEGFEIYAGSDIEILSAYAVRYDGNLGATAIDLLDSNVGSIAMTEYDSIFTDRNVNTPLFFRLEITGFKETGQKLKVTIPCSSGTAIYSAGTKIANNLSNVVCAKFLTGLGSDGSIKDTYDFSSSDLTVRANNIKASFNGMLAHASNGLNKGTPFVDAWERTLEKSGSISIELSSTVAFASGLLIDGVDEQNNPIKKAIVYIELDYYVEDVTKNDVTKTINLVSNYISSYNGGEHSNYFASDISTISIDTEDE